MGEDSGYFSRRSCQFRLPTRKQHQQQTDTGNCKKKSSNGYDCNATTTTTSSVANCINKSEAITTSGCCDAVTAANNYNNTSITVANCTNNNCRADLNSNNSGDHCYSCDRLQFDLRCRPVEQNEVSPLSPGQVLDEGTEDRTNCNPSNSLNSSINSCSQLVDGVRDANNDTTCTSNLPSSFYSRPVHQVGSSAIDTDTTYNTGSSSSSGGYYAQTNNSCGRTTFSPNSILHLKYTDLKDLNSYRNLCNVFTDEQDFEEFKQELQDFQCLKESLQKSGCNHDYQASPLRETPENIEEQLVQNNRIGISPSNSPILTSINQQDQQSNKLNNNSICDDQNANCLTLQQESFSTRNSGGILGSDILPVPLATAPAASLSSLHPSSETSSSCQPRFVNTCISSSPTPSSCNKARIASSISRRSSSNSSPPLKYLSSSFRNALAPHDMLMDFFKSDENFQEFEREFANLDNDFNVFGQLGRIEDSEDGDEVFATRDRKRDVESEGRSSIPMEINVQQDSNACSSNGHKPLTELRVRHSPAGAKQDVAVAKGTGKNDSFSDFFDNDEDFKEFEKEFANFKLRRRSRAFADDFNRRSNCDLFADFFPKFENQEKIERRNRGSANDWDYLFNKIKRNSGFLTDVNELQGTPCEISQNPTFLAIQPPKRTTEDISTPLCRTNENPARKPIEIAVQRRPPLPPLVTKHPHFPCGRHNSPSSQKKPLELKIEHVSSPVSLNFRNDSPVPMRKPTLIDEADREESHVGASPTVLHIDETPVSNNPDSTTGTTDASNSAEELSHIIIEHHFTGGVSKPTLTITRRTNKSLDEDSESQPPVSKHSQQLPELRDRRCHTDPTRIIIEHRFSPRELEPGSSKQNRFSTALEFLQDVDSDKVKDKEKPHKDCQYTCHKTCRQLVTLDCANNLPNSMSDGSIETSLSEPASTPGSNSTVSDTLSNDETDSGYRSGPIPDEILPKKEPSEATLNREELQSKLQEYNNNVPNANLALDSNTKCSKKPSDMDSGCSLESNDFGLEHSSESTESQPTTHIASSEENSCPDVALVESDSDFYEDESINLASNESDGETFQGFIKVTLNLIRPITMSLGARPPSIYEVLTREHIVEQNTQSISFYMPRDTVKSIHVDSETTTKEVIAALLKKFKILDNPRKFAMYEQEFKNKKLVKLRRVMPEEFPLQVCLGWETNKLECYRLVLQENEASGDIEWSNFSHPELNNFVKVLDREESEHIQQLQYKYHMMKKAVERRMKELRAAEQEAKRSK
ncbi:uncharacterized protein LOC115213513 isoform X3 [Octopus sinensis]|uniref:Uncharacterized protein LOC115213513 isoform X3 n=1 Tax=Octopus sinensis TaxID=2607531 RepID=A0A6P7SK76_9MOLL|nr:uncharacterized protein LOC115213513 isoform X3 [Octopus sinensis]